MNPGLVVKLRPAGPWRIGPDSGARNRVDVIYHSDSLYSAVTSAMSRMGSLAEWLDATARSQTPAVCFSSCFPFLDDIGFVVPPRTIWPPTSPAAMSARVRWKSARFIPLGVVESILSGKKLNENQWSVDGASGCLVPAGKAGPFRTSVRWNAAVDRLSGASERHATACIEFREGCGLWTVVGFPDEASRDRWQEPVKAAFRLLADSGFGGERSRGWGRAETPEFVEGTLPGLIIEYKQKQPSPAPPVEEPPSEEPPVEEPPPTGEPTPEPEPPVEAELGGAEEAEVEGVAPEGAAAGQPLPDGGGSDEVAPEAEVAGEAAVEVEAAGQTLPDGGGSDEVAPEAEVAGEVAAEVEAAGQPLPDGGGSDEVAPEAEVAGEAAVEVEAAGQPLPDGRGSDEVAPEAEVAGEVAVEVEAAGQPLPDGRGSDGLVLEAKAGSEPVAAVEAVASEEGSPGAPVAAAVRASDRTEPMRVTSEPEASPSVPAPAVRLQAHWLLSLFTPAADDAVDWGRGSYSVLARGGRIESPSSGSGELKKQIQMVAEGSVLYADGVPMGAAADVAPDGFAHPVFRAGFALAIPLPEVH